MSALVVSSQSRSDFGKGASRRLRKTNMVPGIVYGAGKDPVAIMTEQRLISKLINDEAFYASIISLEIDGKTEQVILRDLQHHPAKELIMHTDFLRVRADQEITVGVPLHYLGEDECEGVKVGGAISKIDVEIEIICLPQDLPEHIDVDVSALALGDSIHLSEVKLPEGVSSKILSYGEDHDRAIVSVHVLRGGSGEEESTDEISTEEPSDDKSDDS